MKPVKVHLDFETRSFCDLKKTGAVRYAMDPSTEILIACWCLEYPNKVRSPVRAWKIGSPVPSELTEAVASGVTVCAHNAVFEFGLWTYVADPKLGWGSLRAEQMDCTMSRAYVMSLPGDLDSVTRVLDLRVKKNPDGKALIRRFSVPMKPRKSDPDQSVRFFRPEDAPDDFDRFISYCADDVRAECAVDDALPQLSLSEREVYHFDLKVNFRGFRLDTKMMQKADAFVKEAALRIDAELDTLTGGAVQKSTQVAKLKTWLGSRGITVKAMAKGDIEDVVTNAKALGDTTAERAVRLRQMGGKATSLAKYQSGLNCAGFDERARGLMVYHKATTGRWAGSLYQPHNLERIDAERDGALVEKMLDILLTSSSPKMAVDWSMFAGFEPMKAIGKCTRAMIRAADGYELIGADYSNVEGRGSAWIAKEHWKIRAFQEYDEGIGPDLYKLAYANALGKEVESVDKLSRQIGKVMELACIAEGQLVLTDVGLVPIEEITLQHKLWDGDSWVSHEGVVYRGEKECIHYDGLTATHDHIVWISESDTKMFGEAAREGADLYRPIGAMKSWYKRDRNDIYVTDTAVRTYDILNAGPNNRFTVSGVLVHNCGYQGAVGAYSKMAALQGLDLDKIREAVVRIADADLWGKCLWKYKRKGANHYGLDEDTWVALRYVVDSWRAAHPGVVSAWWALQDAFVEAVAAPGNMIELFDGRAKVYCQKNQRFLYLYLPSGRPLAYFRPRIKTQEEDDGEGGKRIKRSVIVEGRDSKKGSNYWGDVSLYGGLEYENLVQAMCRDLLVNGMMNLERAGYPVVLHVHDEAVVEILKDTGSEDEVRRLLTQRPWWASDFPLTSASWRDQRYVK